MTSAQFDQETAARLLRIQTNPNPRSFRARIRRSIAWGRSLDRAAAFDSIRNVLCVIGAATILADFGTMRLWMALPCVLVAGAVWYIDYLRHF